MSGITAPVPPAPVLPAPNPRSAPVPRYCVIVPNGPNLHGKGYQRRAAQFLEAVDGASVVCVPGRRRGLVDALRTVVSGLRLPLSVLAFQARMDFAPPEAELYVFFTSRCMVPGFDRPFIVDFVDAISNAYRYRSNLSRNPLAKLFWSVESKRVAAYDQDVIQRAVAASAITGRDVTSLGPKCRVVSEWPQIAEGPQPALRAGSATNVVFFGHLSYHPNRFAADWIESALVPVLGSAVGVRLLGRGGSRATKRLPHYYGEYDQLVDVVDDRTVCVVPVVSGAGLQTKVIEGAALGLPQVVTPFVAEGLAKPLPSAIRVADGADAFASAVTSMSVSAGDREALRAWAFDNYSRTSVLQNWRTFLVESGVYP